MFGEAAAGSIDELLDADTDRLTDGELSEHLLALDKLRSRVDAAFRRIAGRWDARRVWEDDGAPNGPVWLAARAGLSGAAARCEMRTARRLGSLSEVSEASDTGSLCSAKVSLLARAADDKDEAIAKAFSRDEAMLVDHAKRLTVDQTARVLRYWRACADAAAARDDAARLHDQRGVHLSRTFGGAWRLDGELEPEAGAIVADALERIGEELYRAEKSAADDGIVHTSAAQRRADALTEMARRAAGADPHGDPARPLVAVTVDLETLEGRADHPVELDLQGIVTPEAARRLACDAGIVRIITDAKGEPLDLGRTTYVPSRAQRRALTLRDRGCVFPGCDRPPGWCAAHHIKWWTRDGPTDLDNLCLLCSHHHHLVHEGHWGLRRLGDGSLRFTRPDRTELRVDPAA